jgi:hypothetical protein
MIRSAVVGLSCLALWSSPAGAHFVWVDLKQSADGQPQAQLYLSELPEPGEPHLIAKVAQSKAWIRGLESSVELKFAPAADKDLAALVAACPKQSAASLEAICDYGVYSRGPVGVLLNYYAKRLIGDWTNHADKLARAERLALDIVPGVDGDELSLVVLYNGKPVADGELVIVDPTGESHDSKTDSQGRGTIRATAAGRYAIRSGYVEADRSGTREGKKYAQTWHYCTLTLDVKTADKTSADKSANKAAGEPTALEALTRARDGRSIWHDFPGFTADLAVTSGGDLVKGKVSIDASGTVELDMPKSPVADWVEEQLNSLVQHRMPDGEVTQGEVKYADNDLTHPLGRKIDLGDPSLQSAYRLKDDVIMEVNRSMGPMRFTISVLEIIRNAENKYLPRSFTMNFFSAKSGELKTSLSYLNEWQRVGAFDLPKTIVEVSAQQGGAGTKQIVFSNCKLTEKK